MFNMVKVARLGQGCPKRQGVYQFNLYQTANISTLLSFYLSKHSVNAGSNTGVNMKFNLTILSALLDELKLYSN